MAAITAESKSVRPPPLRTGFVAGSWLSQADPPDNPPDSDGPAAPLPELVRRLFLRELSQGSFRRASVAARAAGGQAGKGGGGLLSVLCGAKARSADRRRGKANVAKHHCVVLRVLGSAGTVLLRYSAEMARRGASSAPVILFLGFITRSFRIKDLASRLTSSHSSPSCTRDAEKGGSGTGIRRTSEKSPPVHFCADHPLSHQ